MEIIIGSTVIMYLKLHVTVLMRVSPEWDTYYSYPAWTLIFAYYATMILNYIFRPPLLA